MLLLFQIYWSAGQVITLLLFQITTAAMKAADMEAAVDSVFGVMDKLSHYYYFR